MSGKNVIIVIPAYRPDEILIRLIEKLMDQTILVIDDGSGEAYSEIFIKAEKLGAMILGYRENKGKGCALKYAFQWIYSVRISRREFFRQNSQKIYQIFGVHLLGRSRHTLPQN